MALTALLVVALVTADAGASRQTRAYLGRPVAEVLQEAQVSGVRILFSSDLVPATLRVTVEPTSREPRQLALQILAPATLQIVAGLVIVTSGAISGPGCGDARQ